MAWIFFALLSRLLWSGCNATDQMLSRAHKSLPTSSAFVLNFCFTLPTAILAFFFSDTDFTPFMTMWPWILSGALASAMALAPYLWCVQKEEAYNVVPFFELTPVILTIMAIVLHDELPSLTQIAGGLLVILCGFLFSWDFKRGRVKRRILGYMLVSASLYAFYQLSARTIGEGHDVWIAASAIFGVEGLIGLILFAAMKHTRADIVTSAAQTKGRTLLLALLTNILSFLALVSLIHAFNIAPTTGHVAALSGAQPFFSIFLAVILGWLLPTHYERVYFNAETRAKLLFIIGIVAGIYFLTMG